MAEHPQWKRTELFRLNGTLARDPRIDEWFNAQISVLGAIAREWFERMRECGDEFRETLHDGCPTACLGDAAFGYVNVFTSHVNVGFFQGSELRDPEGLLQGTGKFMRHVKLQPGAPVNAPALDKLIEAAYENVKEHVEQG